MSIYKNQTDFMIELNTQRDLSGIVDARIGFTKPSGAEGYFTADVYGNNAVRYLVQNTSDIDEAGEWVFRAGIYVNDAWVYGNPVHVNVQE